MTLRQSCVSATDLPTKKPWLRMAAFATRTHTMRHLHNQDPMLQARRNYQKKTLAVHALDEQKRYHS